MPYTDTWGTKPSPIALSDLDRAFSEAANALYDSATAFQPGTVGYTVQGLVTQLQNALATLNSFPSVAFLLNRANDTGFDPATSVLLNNQLTVQQYIDQLEIRLAQLGTGSSSGSTPQNTVQPGAPTGNTVVGQFLTGVNGTWNNASTFTRTWFRIQANTGIISAIGASGANYQLQAADFGYKVADSVVGYSAANVPGPAVLSAFSNIVTSVLATSVTGPSIAPAGNQTTGQQHTVNVGTWNGAASYGVQFYLNSVPQGTRGSNVNFTSNAALISEILTFDVVGYNNFGVPSANAIAGTNSVTFTGNAAFSKVSAPSFNGSLVIGQTSNINLATWSATPDTARFWDVYVNNMPTPYGTISSGPFFTPESDGSQFLSAQTAAFYPPNGLSSLNGQTIRITERVSFLGQSYTSNFSANYVVSGASANFTVTPNAQNNIGWSFVAGSQITQVTLAAMSGGNTPYSIASMNLPNGMTASVSGTSLNMTGTPGTVASSRTYGVIVRDASAAQINIPINIAITSQSQQNLLPADDYFTPTKPFSQMAGYAQLLGGQVNLSSISDTNGISASGAISSLPTNATPTLRLGKILDPAGSGKQVLYMATKNTDPPTYNHVGRVEIGMAIAGGALGNIPKSGKKVWFGQDIYLTADYMNTAGEGTLCDIHNSNPPSITTGPWEIGLNDGSIFPNRSVYVQRINSTDGTSITDNGYGFTSDNPGFPAISGKGGTDGIAQTYGTYPRNAWVRWIIAYQGDPTGFTGSLEAWIGIGGTVAGGGWTFTKVLDQHGIRIGSNDAPAGYPLDYFKSGLDDEHTAGGSNGLWTLRGPVGQWPDQGYTFSMVNQDMINRG